MGTKCKFKNGKQVFSSDAQMLSGGTISTNQQIVSSTTETVLVSETIYGNTFDATTMGFRVTLAGEISANAGSDITLTLRYGTTDILALATVTLAAEDDKQFKYECLGRIHTTGATGKIVASSRIDIEQGTPLMFAADTAAAGVTANLTADGSLNVTGHWDASNANSDIIAMIGFIEFFN
ncbi:MAG: hypothetical protein GQ540_03560 [Lutibacter sp.]|uniref:hypothetical protein n=1 Tax=Lutibacter sp. TaxID=1925666 RepID=UPI0019E7B820|nr:hypothetical protein [Lutibacter sp.]NOR27589.1 hypothetical protein [Lutibacter sp.]